jgi:hypothetical protein
VLLPHPERPPVLLALTSPELSRCLVNGGEPVNARDTVKGLSIHSGGGRRVAPAPVMGLLLHVGELHGM